MAKLAYFILLLLVASYCQWKVEAEAAVEETGSSGWISSSSRKFLGNGHLLKMMGIDTDAEKAKKKCVRYRKPCKGPEDCCQSCYCKAFGTPTSFVTLCDGSSECHVPQ